MRFIERLLPGLFQWHCFAGMLLSTDDREPVLLAGGSKLFGTVMQAE
jgi:hypothetical protein